MSVRTSICADRKNFKFLKKLLGLFLLVLMVTIPVVFVHAVKEDLNEGRDDRKVTTDTKSQGKINYDTKIDTIQTYGEVNNFEVTQEEDMELGGSVQGENNTQEEQQSSDYISLTQESVPTEESIETKQEKSSDSNNMQKAGMVITTVSMAIFGIVVGKKFNGIKNNNNMNARDKVEWTLSFEEGSGNPIIEKNFKEAGAENKTKYVA